MSGPIYGEDLAYVHDAGFSAEAPVIARELVRRLRERGIRDGLIVELGCGSGRLASAPSFPLAG